MDRTSVFARNTLALALTGFCASGFCSIEEAGAGNLITLSDSPLSLRSLDQQRGGFIDANGLKIQIGLEKVVLVDGIVAARSRLVVPKLDLKSTMAPVMADAKEQMATAKSNLNETLTESRKVMDQQLAPTLDAISQVLSDPSDADNKGPLSDVNLTPQDAIAVKALSESLNRINTRLKEVPAMQATSSGASLDVKSNAQSGVNTENATLSLAHTDQVSSGQPGYIVPVSSLSPAEVEKASPQSVQDRQFEPQYLLAPLQPSMMVDQALTRVTEVGNTTLIQNAADNRLIQTVQVLNIELSNFSRFRGQRIQTRLLPQMIQYQR